MCDLPRRVPDLREDYAAWLTEELKIPGGTMTLRPIQAAALTDLAVHRGLFAPIVVGGGKTLITFLAPTVLRARRPLLIIPAALREKTIREFAVLERHWQTPPHAYTLMSYAELSRDKGLQTLGVLEPDLIICDEVHRLKNPRAACTKRMVHYMREHPETIFAGMSGTITSRSLMDFWHLLQWTHGPERMPLPNRKFEAQEWGRAVDEKVEIRAKPGALAAPEFDAHGCIAQGDLPGAREAVRRRIVETRGVVATQSARPGMSLNITTEPLGVACKEIGAKRKELQDTWTVTNPSYSVELMDAAQVWRVSREIALGFHYYWEPEPPREWLLARSDWAKVVREVVSYGRKGVDSEMTVARAIETEGLYPHFAHAYHAWRAIKDSYAYESMPLWFSDAALERVNRHVRKSSAPTIIWVQHDAFGERLSGNMGVKYFAQKGRSKDGHYIEDFAGQTVIASVHANAEGRNLQAWARNVMVGVYPNGKLWEQMLGRTHRPGQTADEVEALVLITCDEDRKGWAQVRADADYIASGLQEQKLGYATILERHA